MPAPRHALSFFPAKSHPQAKGSPPTSPTPLEVVDSSPRRGIFRRWLFFFSLFSGSLSPWLTRCLQPQWKFLSRMTFTLPFSTPVSLQKGCVLRVVLAFFTPLLILLPSFDPIQGALFSPHRHSPKIVLFRDQLLQSMDFSTFMRYLHELQKHLFNHLIYELSPV